MKRVIKYIISKIRYIVRPKYEMLSRMFFWGWHMRNSYDFDASTTYDMLYLKLNRVYNCMKGNSHCVWNSNENTNLMRKLREAVELCRREANCQEEYDMKAWKETEALYGKAYNEKTEAHPTFGSLFRLRWNNDKEATIYWKKREKHWASVHKQNKNRLFELLNSRLDYW